jgi:hypothetical protein
MKQLIVVEQSYNVRINLETIIALSSMMHIVELNYYELHLNNVKILDDLTNG